MAREALRVNLQQLRQELSEPGSLDDETRQQLAEIADKIEELLQAQSPDYADAHASIQDAALRFEATHPAFSRIMSEVTDALAKLGV